MQNPPGLRGRHTILGKTASPVFVRGPEENEIPERLIRTLKDNLPYHSYLAPCQIGQVRAAAARAVA